MSGYDSTSLVSQINRGENPPLDSLFIECFNLSKDIYEATGGAFDISGAPLFDIWGFGFKSGELPDDALVAQTIATSGMKRLKSDMNGLLSEDGTLAPASLLADGLQDQTLPKLNYNAIAPKLGKKTVSIPEVKIGYGVLSTSELLKKCVVTASTAPDAFKRIIEQKQEANIKFLIGQANLRTSELGDTSA